MFEKQGIKKVVWVWAGVQLYLVFLVLVGWFVVVCYLEEFVVYLGRLQCIFLVIVLEGIFGRQGICGLLVSFGRWIGLLQGRWFWRLFQWLFWGWFFTSLVVNIEGDFVLGWGLVWVFVVRGFGKGSLKEFEFFILFFQVVL